MTEPNLLYTYNPKTKKMEAIPFLFKLMQNSSVLKLFYEYVIINVSTKVSNVDFLKNKNNIKYIVLAICLIFSTLLISMLSYFLFYIMFFFSSLKCILWLFEVYNPDTTNNSSSSSTLSVNPDHYEFNATSQDVLEYYVILIFILLIMHPVTYLPIPFLSLLAYVSSVTICSACLTERTYRQRCCLYIRDSFTSKESRDDDGTYIPGNEGEFHKLLQAICHSLDCVNMTIYNITHNPRIMLNQLNNSENVTQALCLISSGVDTIVTDIRTYQSKRSKQSNQHNQYNKHNQNNQSKKSKKQKQSTQYQSNHYNSNQCNQPDQPDHADHAYHAEQKQEVIADVNETVDVLNDEDDLSMFF